MLLFRFQYIVRVFFCDLGRITARYPLPFLVIPVIVAIACSVGIYLNKDLMSIDYETSLNDFFPESSESWQNMQSLRKLFFMDKFASFTGISFLFLKKNLVYVIMTSGMQNGSVVNEHGLRCASDLIGRIKDIKVIKNGLQYSWKDVCFRSEQGECGEHPIVQTLSLLKNTHQISPSMQPLLYYPTVVIDNFSVDNAPIFGGVTTRRSDGALTRAVALRMPFFLRESANEDELEINDLWRKEFLKTMESVHYPGYSLHWCTWLSLIEEIQRNCDTLVTYLPYLALVLLVMTIGGCCDGNKITSKPWLGLWGLFSAIFATLTATGILFYCRYNYIPMVLIMPFLVLSVSVDNVFLMLSAWRSTKPTDSVVDRTAESVGDSAVSILITALTDGLSFSVGNLTPFPAVQIFCTYCALALLCTFVYQMTFFTAVLVLEGRRECAVRHCVTYKKLPRVSEEDERAKNLELKSACQAFDKYNEIFSSSLATVVSSPVCKVFALLLYLSYVAFFSYGIATIADGLNVEHLLPRHSYVSRTLKINDKYFSSYGDYATVFVNQTLLVSKQEDQERLLNVYRSLVSTEYTTPGEFWLVDAISYAAEKNESLHRQRAYQAEMMLNNFFSQPRFQHYLNDVNFDEDSFLVVKSTKMNVRLRNCGRANYTEIAKILRRRFSESSLSGFVFHPSFLLVDQDILVVQTLLQDVLAAVGAMIIVLLLFIPTFCSVAWVTGSLFSICLGVIGILSVWDVHVDIISMITITMSVGLSVDYISHITYYYTSAYGFTTYDRLLVAYRHVGVPTVQSALLAIAGVSSLVFMESHMVETFVKTVFLVVIIGMLHGLFFLPAILSTFMHHSNVLPTDKREDSKNPPPTVSGNSLTTPKANGSVNEGQLRLNLSESGDFTPTDSTSSTRRSALILRRQDMFIANMFTENAESNGLSQLRPVTSPSDVLTNISRQDTRSAHWRNSITSEVIEKQRRLVKPFLKSNQPTLVDTSEELPNNAKRKPVIGGT